MTGEQMFTRKLITNVALPNGMKRVNIRVSQTKPMKYK